MRKPSQHPTADRNGGTSRAGCTPPWRLRLLAVGLSLLAGAAASMQSPAPGLEEWLSNVPGFRFRRVETVAEWQGARSVGRFGAQLLQEVALLSFSRWGVAPADPDAAALSIEMEVYETLDSQGAFGLFTALRSKDFSDPAAQRPDLEVDSVYLDGSLTFWRGRHCLLLTSSVSGADRLVELAKSLIEASDEINLYPMSVGQLPSEGLIRESIHFYLGPGGLATNPVFPALVIPHVGFEDGAEVAFARYQPDGNSLFLIGYPTASLAEEYFPHIRRRLNSVISAEGIYTKRSGMLLGIFMGPEEDARRILERVQYTATVKWIYEKELSEEEIRRRRGEVITFFGIVTDSILFTGAFILFVLVLGFFSGLLRYQILKRFPRLAARDEMITLKLDSRAGTTDRTNAAT